MSTVTLLILPSVIKQRTQLHSNVDDKLIVPDIKAVQDMYVRPLLGSKLFDLIIDQIANNNLSADNILLMEDFIVDIVCNYVLSELPEGLNYQFYNKGLSTKTQEGSQVPPMSEMYAIVGRFKKRAEHYCDICRKFILENIDKYPSYNESNNTTGVTPQQNIYTCPVYLGED